MSTAYDSPIVAERDVDGQLLGHPDREQVDVEHPPVDRVALDPLDEDRGRLLAVDRQVDERVLADPALEQLELVAVEGERLGRDAVAEDDRRELAGPAQAGDALAEHVALGGGQSRPIAAHGVGGSSVVVHRAR